MELTYDKVVDCSTSTSKPLIKRWTFGNRTEHAKIFTQTLNGGHMDG